MSQRENVAVKDLPSHNVRIITRDMSEFTRLYAATVKIPKDLATQIEKFSIFIINNSDNAITAYQVKWEFVQKNGKKVSKTTARSNFDSFSALGRENQPPIISAHAKYFSTIFDEIVVNQDGATVTLVSDQPQFPENMKSIVQEKLSNDILELQKLMENCTEWSVSLDGVFFSNGTFIGPNTTDYFERVKARLDAKIEVLNEISRIFALPATSQAQSHAVVFKYAERLLKETPAKKPGFSAEAFYDRSKHNFAKEIIGQRTKSSDEQAIKNVLNEMPYRHIKLVKM